MKTPQAKPSAADVGSTMMPMIDVVFQLLIYFLLTASFQQKEQFLPTTLPPTGGAREATPEVQELGIIELSLSEVAGIVAIGVNGVACADFAELESRLTALAAQADLPVVLDIGPRVQMKYAVRAFDTCMRTGLHQINFAAPDSG